MGRYDPAHGPASAVLRAGLLAYRARYGDEKAVELSRKIRGWVVATYTLMAPREWE